MAKRKTKRKKSKSSGMRKGACKIITGPGGKRKICRRMDGRVVFKPMSYSPRKSR